MDEENKNQNTEVSAADQLSRERDEYLAGWQRAKADLANYKKEETDRLKLTARFQLESVCREILPVLDSFELGLENSPDKKGLEMIRSQLWDVLRRLGLQKVSSPPGSVFDPARQEAVGEIPSAEPPGTVAKEAGPGYALEEKIIRPVRVLLSQGPENNN